MNSTTKGGARPGAGRPTGSMMRMSQEAREAAQASGRLPHEILLDMARGKAVRLERIDPNTGEVTTVLEQATADSVRDAAKAAAPYYAPKISTVEVINGLPDNELDSIIARLAAEAGIDLGDGGKAQTDATSSPAPSRRRIDPD